MIRQKYILITVRDTSRNFLRRLSTFSGAVVQSISDVDQNTEPRLLCADRNF